MVLRTGTSSTLDPTVEVSDSQPNMSSLSVVSGRRLRNGGLILCTKVNRPATADKRLPEEVSVPRATQVNTKHVEAQSSNPPVDNHESTEGELTTTNPNTRSIVSEMGTSYSGSCTTSRISGASYIRREK